MRYHREGTDTDRVSWSMITVSHCPYCGDMLVAPEISELVDDAEIRHQWLCDHCGRQSRISVDLTPRARPTRQRVVDPG
jgi:hypothetical protein